MIPREQIRNIALVAHVDHGKTTLVDHMLRQAGIFGAHELLVERVLDSNDLEREKGITILAKNTAVSYRGVKINIVDTPGHADFGGEVERALRLVDGVLLLVDAAEGPLPQTRFVLSKALSMNLRTVLVINKIDRHDARPAEVLDLVYSLYIDLGAEESQIDFPVVYAVAREGRAESTVADALASESLDPLFEAILDHVPSPPPGARAELQLLVDNIDYDDYVGRLAVGRVSSGVIRTNDPIAILREHDTIAAKVVRLYGFDGLRRVELQEAGPGEIVCIAGVENIGIGDTISDPAAPMALPRIYVDKPTMSMVFKVNDGPFAGREGQYVTSRKLRERLYREAHKNVSILVEDTDTPDAFKVMGRGELQLAVIVENMRRDGYELTVSNPVPILTRIDGAVHEPMELLICDVPDETVGTITQRLGPRRGRMIDINRLGSGRTRLQFRAPTRGLVGFPSELLTVTRGEGIVSSQFDGYEPWLGRIDKRKSGAIVADRGGAVVAYACFHARDRGSLFVKPGQPVYTGMVVGEHNHENDIEFNITKEKKLTNIRAANRDENIILTPPLEMTLEKALAWIAEDELVEVTPKSVRLRKKYLDPHKRYNLERDRKRGLADVS